MMAYIPAGAACDSVPWVAFTVGWVLFWIALIIAVRGAPKHEPLPPDRW
jgi:hypothetical protein